MSSLPPKLIRETREAFEAMLKNMGMPVSDGNSDELSEMEKMRFFALFERLVETIDRASRRAETLAIGAMVISGVGVTIALFSYLR